MDAQKWSFDVRIVWENWALRLIVCFKLYYLACEINHTIMTTRELKSINPTSTKAWQALQSHYEQMKEVHMRDLFEIE